MDDVENKVDDREDEITIALDELAQVSGGYAAVSNRSYLSAASLAKKLVTWPGNSTIPRQLPTFPGFPRNGGLGWAAISDKEWQE